MRFKQIKQKLQEDQDLFEINMSPNNLEKLSNQIDARAGMEFEMIVPNVGNEEEFESEPDFGMDELVNSFEEIEDFFSGHHNSPSHVRRLVSNLVSDFRATDDDLKQAKWEEESADAVYRYMWLSYKHRYKAEAKTRLDQEYPEMDQDSLDFKTLVLELAKEILQERIEAGGKDYLDAYDEAYDEWEAEWENDMPNRVKDWLREEGIETMSDVSSIYNLEWPYWTEYDEENQGLKYIANDFSRSVGKPINWSKSYHGAVRKPGHYVVEPDGSIKPENSSESGLEFVSPPLPLDEMLSDLEKVKEWAYRNGCYTNDSTGLHINVSVPGYSRDKLDYVKLALLLGDEQVLGEFGRLGNSYCESAMELLRSRISRDPNSANKLLEKMRNGLEQLASKVIHSGRTDKHTSINTKENYVEFRSPGGNWLDENTFKQVKPTLLRFVVALEAAMDPEKYKNEYYKKLYKLLKSDKYENESYNKLIDEFSRYVVATGGSRTDKYSKAEIEVLKLIRSSMAKELKRSNLEKNISKFPPGQKFVWKVNFHNFSIEVIDSSREKAKEQAATHWRLDHSQREAISDEDVRLIGPYDPGTDQIPTYDPGTDQIPTSVTRGVDRRFTNYWLIKIDGQIVHRFSGVGNVQADANNFAQRWILAQGTDFLRQYQGGEVEVVPEFG